MEWSYPKAWCEEHSMPCNGLEHARHTKMWKNENDVAQKHPERPDEIKTNNGGCLGSLKGQRGLHDNMVDQMSLFSYSFCMLACLFLTTI